MLHLIALGFLAAVVRDPRLMEELERDSNPGPDYGERAAVLPTPLSNVEPPPSSYPQHAAQPRDHTLIYRKYPWLRSTIQKSIGDAKIVTSYLRTTLTVLDMAYVTQIINRIYVVVTLI